MQDIQDHERWARNLEAAFAHLLLDEPGRQGELEHHLTIVAGPPVDEDELTQWSEAVRASGRPVVCLWAHEDLHLMPNVALLSVSRGQPRIHEGCALWLGRDGGRARIVPDDFRSGSYVVGDDLGLARLRHAPAPDSKSTHDGLVRAYTRLARLVREQQAGGASPETAAQAGRLAA